MGLAAQILWSRSRSDLFARAALGDPAKTPEIPNEELADDNLRWLLVMFRVGTVIIALFQIFEILDIVYLESIPGAVKEPRRSKSICLLRRCRAWPSRSALADGLPAIGAGSHWRYAWR
jgi:hypothetical protein